VSSVSRRIRDLEAELGALLFIRHRSGVRLTYAGELFLKRARRALSQIHSAAKDVLAITEPWRTGKSPHRALFVHGIGLYR
jgi:DNA-binding transcriptional LysR family regulator